MYADAEIDDKGRSGAGGSAGALHDLQDSLAMQIVGLPSISRKTRERLLKACMDRIHAESRGPAEPRESVLHLHEQLIAIVTDGRGGTPLSDQEKAMLDTIAGRMLNARQHWAEGLASLDDGVADAKRNLFERERITCARSMCGAAAMGRDVTGYEGAVVANAATKTDRAGLVVTARRLAAAVARAERNQQAKASANANQGAARPRAPVPLAAVSDRLTPEES